VPEVNPVTVTGDVAFVAVKDPGVEVTVNPDKDFPPVALDVTGTEAEVVPPKGLPVTFVGVPVVGACGTVVIVADSEAAEAKAFPYPLVAVTVKVKAVFEGIPVTTIGEDDPDAEYPPVVDAAVKDVTNPPPEPAVNAILAAPLLNARDVPTSVATADVAEVGITPSCDHPADV
jgi:hypothetical protein